MRGGGKRTGGGSWGQSCKKQNGKFGTKLFGQLNKYFMQIFKYKIAGKIYSSTDLKRVFRKKLRNEQLLLFASLAGGHGGGGGHEWIGGVQGGEGFQLGAGA